jgi:hypothetical protein
VRAPRRDDRALQTTSEHGSRTAQETATTERTRECRCIAFIAHRQALLCGERRAASAGHGGESCLRVC